MTGRAATILLAAVLAETLAAGCGGKRMRAPGKDADRSAQAELHQDAAGASIYVLDLALLDQDGRALKLADLRGRPLVAAMMYSSCQSVCPRVTEDMKGIEKQLAEADRERVDFVMFSLDPGRDTPEALRGFAREHGLDPARWRLFAASEEGVRDLAAVLGVKYRKENGQFAHSAMIFVIDAGGVVRHRQVGLNQNPGELLTALRQAR